MVACRNDWPSLVTGWVTDAIPCVPASAVLTWPALDAVEITSMGSPEPAGKYLDSTFCAAMDGGVPRNDWAAVSVPNLKPIIPAAPAAELRARGRRAELKADPPARPRREQDGRYRPHRARTSADGLADPGPEPAAGRVGRGDNPPRRAADTPRDAPV